MYCTECGKPGAGKFCGHCGTSMGVATGPAESRDPAQTQALGPVDWSNEHRYEVLVRIAEVRERIAHAAARAARKTMTAEEFLQVGDKLLSPLTGGVPIGKLAAVVQPLYAKLGIQTGKRREQVLERPIGAVLAATLCGLASSGLKLRRTEQFEAGCSLEAELPSDLFSFAGDVRLEVTRQGTGTRIAAATHVPGQMYDWGKSTRCLDALFGEIAAALGGHAASAAEAA